MNADSRTAALIKVYILCFNFENKYYTRCLPNYYLFQCLVHRRLGWVMFGIMAVFVLAMFLAVLWAWLGGGAASRSFHEHFALAEKEEIFLTELEENLDCITDDDKEVADEHVSVAWSFLYTLFVFCQHVLHGIPNPQRHISMNIGMC